MMNIISAQIAHLFPRLSLSMPALEILLLEQHSQDAFFMTKVLNQIGKVFWEQNIEGGLEAAKQRNFDIALLDLSVENKYTLDAFHHFHENRPDILIVLISDAESLLLAESAIDHGAFNVINKHRLHQGDYLIKMVTAAIIRAKFIKKAKEFCSKTDRRNTK